MAPNVWDVLSESKRIINSQPRHFLTLSLIFLLPISFLSLIFQLIIKHLQHQQPPTNPSIFLSLLFLISSSIFSYSAIITITYSVYNAFFNRPIKLKDAIKSISTYFFPFLATDTVIAAIFFVCFLFALLIVVVSFLITYLGGVNLKSSYTYTYLIVLLYKVSLLIFITYLVVNLSLVKVIVVVESLWGFEPLKRSWKLVKGMKRLVWSTFLLFGFLEVILMSISGKSLVLVFIISLINAMILLYNIAVYTVIYIYCNEKHGKLQTRNLGRKRTRLIPS